MKYIFSSSLIWIILLIVHTIYIWLIKLENASINSLLLLFKLSIYFLSPFFLGILAMQFLIDKFRIKGHFLLIFSIGGFLILWMIYIIFELSLGSKIHMEEVIEMQFSIIAGIIHFLMNKFLLKTNN
jgi:hypothetical protein